MLATVFRPVSLSDYFWGYKTAGVFQNREEIEAWKSSRQTFHRQLQKHPQPGDCEVR
jgi:hypothetical protein